MTYLRAEHRPMKPGRYHFRMIEDAEPSVAIVYLGSDGQLWQRIEGSGWAGERLDGITGAAWSPEPIDD